MLFCPEEEPGVRLRRYQQMMGWDGTGWAGDKCWLSGRGQVLTVRFWPGANCHEGEAVPAVLPFCRGVDFKPLFHHQLPSRLWAEKKGPDFLLFSLDFSHENNIDRPHRHLVLMLHARRAWPGKTLRTAPVVNSCSCRGEQLIFLFRAGEVP